MQSLCGNLRWVARQMVNGVKSVDLRPTAPSSFVGHSSLLRQPKIASDSPLWANNGIPSIAMCYKGSKICVPQSAAMMSTLHSRCITTMGDSIDPVAENPIKSSEVPGRIKFKRLDKTARHIMQIIDNEEVEKVKAQREIPDIRPGYIVQLKVEVPENKRRVSIVKGIVIARRNAGINTTFRLRRLVAGVGVESLFPLYSPNIKEIKVVDKKKVRRAKLYYLRDKMNALKR